MKIAKEWKEGKEPNFHDKTGATRKTSGPAEVPNEIGRYCEMLFQRKNVDDNAYQIAMERLRKRRILKGARDDMDKKIGRKELQDVMEGLFRVTDKHVATNAEVGILTLAWRCLYAETVGSHVDKRTLRLGRALKRFAKLLRSRLWAYGEKWERWVHTGRDKAIPHVIPMKHHDKQVIASDWIGQYEIHPAIEDMAKHGEPTGRWESPDRRPPERLRWLLLPSVADKSMAS